MAEVFRVDARYGELKTPFRAMSYARSDRSLRDRQAGPSLRSGIAHASPSASRAPSFASSNRRWRAAAPCAASWWTTGERLPKKDVDELEAVAKAAGAGGLLSLRCADGRLAGVAAKFLGEAVERRVIDTLGLREGGLLLALVGKPADVVGHSRTTARRRCPPPRPRSGAGLRDAVGQSVPVVRTRSRHGRLHAVPPFVLDAVRGRHPVSGERSAARARAPLRLGVQRHRAGVGEHPHPQPRAAGARDGGDRYYQGRRGAALRVSCSTRSSSAHRPTGASRPASTG